ncbi:MAG: exodeoxyribonuclease VII large subunit [Opitutaceae bacterium]
MTTTDASLRDILSVSDLNLRVKTVLQQSIPPAWVRGEVSNLRKQSSGHLYFSLKDDRSQVSAVAFRGNAIRLGLDLRDGMQVIVYGELSVYEPRGAYQLIVRAAIEDGVGRLQMEFERLKKQLADEGLFDATRKKPLPTLPLTVGFVTSPTGAAVQDFLRILRRREWSGRVVVIPVKVQGAGAGAEIVEALNLASQLWMTPDGKLVRSAADAPAAGSHRFFELVVVGRGGGSIEDLWAFNEEAVARAVAACPIPLISAVGHEIDFTLSDFAADVRAETPSAAAELISSGYLEMVERLSAAGEFVEEELDQRLRSLRDQVKIVGTSLELHSPVNALERGFLRIDDLRNRLAGSIRENMQGLRERLQRDRSRLAEVTPAPRIHLLKHRFDTLGPRLERALEVNRQLRNRRLEQLGKHLISLGPESVLKRGFAMVRGAKGRLVSRAGELTGGDQVVTCFADGEVPMVVESPATTSPSLASGS